MRVYSLWIDYEYSEWDDWGLTYNIKYSSEFSQYCKYMYTSVVL